MTWVALGLTLHLWGVDLGPFEIDLLLFWIDFGCLWSGLT